MKLKNDRVQDLFLLGKNHYEVPVGDRIANVARVIVGLHNLYDPAAMNFRDTAHVVVADLVESGVLQLTPHKLGAFLRALGPHPAGRLFGADHEQPGGYYAALIETVLTEVMRTKVIDDNSGEWAMPFPRTEPDPQVVAYLQQHLVPTAA